MESNENNFEIDLEQMLEQYIPSMFRLLDDRNLKKRQWRKLNQRFLEEFYSRKAKYEANDNYLLVEANIYDLITSALTGGESARRLVGYFDVLFKALDRHLIPEEKFMVRDTLYNVLINLDHKFRNFIGELAVLSNAVEGRRYTLVAVEKDIIAGNKTADFTLLNNVTRQKELVEVVNIHLDDSNYLKEALLTKITDKLADKTLNTNDHNAFTLVPVIWAPVIVLKDLQQLYESGQGLTVDSVSEPVAYCAFAGPNDLPVYRFAKVSTLFPKGQILVQWLG